MRKHLIALGVTAMSVALLVLGAYGFSIEGEPQAKAMERVAVVGENVDAAPVSTSTTSTATTSATSSTTTTSTSTTTTTPATSTTAVPAPKARPESTPTTTAAPSAPTTTTQPAPPPPKADFDPGAENSFAASINGVRAEAGLPALTHSGSLRSYARNWAKALAEKGTLAHSGFAGGENLGVGYSVGSIFASLRASGLHYANMTNPDFVAMGVGAWVEPDGRIWTVHVFSK